jgi:hypothetical protein
LRQRCHVNGFDLPGAIVGNNECHAIGFQCHLAWEPAGWENGDCL